MAPVVALPAPARGYSKVGQLAEGHRLVSAFEAAKHHFASGGPLLVA
jgi:hypothetical protein